MKLVRCRFFKVAYNKTNRVNWLDKTQLGTQKTEKKEKREGGDGEKNTN